MGSRTFANGRSCPRIGRPRADNFAAPAPSKRPVRRTIPAASVAVPREASRRSRAGLRAVHSRVMLKGLSAVNRRTKAAREIVKWRAELLADLGGEARLTAAQRTRVETLVRTKLILEHVDAELLEHESLFARKRGRLRKDVRPLLDLRQRMADSLERGLAAVGQVAKHAGPLPSIADLVDQARD
jgi:hypothetical protein